MAIIRRILLGHDGARPAGLMPQATMLEIDQVDGVWQGAPSISFSLYSHHDNGFQGDTRHGTLREAEAQAEYQLGLKPDQWQAVGE